MRVSLGCSALVPKPGTPFARKPMEAPPSIRAKFEVITRALRGRAEFTHESWRWSYWQAVLARGGRELAPALADIAQEADTPASWSAAFQQHALDADRYALREYAGDEPVPWEIV